MLSLFSGLLENIPWTEILTGVASLVLLFLRLANTKLKVLIAQLTPNGGTSLRDSVNRIEQHVGELTAVNEAVQQLSRKPMFKTDPAGNCIWINTSYSITTGKDIEDLKGEGWLSVIHPDHRKMVCDEWESAVNDHRRFDLRYNVVNTNTGNEYLVNCKAYPVIVNKKVTGYIGTWFFLNNEVDD